MNEKIKKLPRIRNDERVQNIIRLALEEDLAGYCDVTSESLVPEDTVITAEIIARENLVVSGIDVAIAVFEKVNTTLNCTAVIGDGQSADTGDVILTITGSARAILTAERTALNFMQRMSGIAIITKAFVDKVAGTNVAILDTRKTTPGLRIFEKYAVLCGGGENHRMGLYDRILIKDNHRRLWRSDDASLLDEAIRTARERFSGIVVEVEVETEEELRSALKEKPEWILLDNMEPDSLRRCVEICAGRCRLEASGGITLDNVVDVAKTGVDAISLGYLTHSAPSVDLSLEIA